jgi:hypothetical protein
MRRTSLLFLALLIGVATNAFAQQKSPEELQKAYEAKLEEAWYKAGGWTEDFEAAMKSAGSSGKMIVGYFHRSYSY